MAAICMASAAIADPRGADLYVATNGSDAWSGRLAKPNAADTDGPFATLARARDAVRKLREKRPDAKIVVQIRGGTYRLTEPLVFTADDSGSPSMTVYEAYPGERPVLSGGKRIAGWRKGDGEIWTAAIPEVKEGKWFFHQLFVNSSRRTRARTPNEGFLTVDGPISNTWEWGKPREEAQRSWLKFRGDDIKPEWAERGDVELIALQSWAEIRMQIRSVDKAAQTVTLSGACSPSNRENNARYWVENAPDMLDSPGEWYLDRQNGVLSYWPIPGEDMTKVEVVAPLLDHLVRFDGDKAQSRPVMHIVLRGLTFRDADWSLPETGYTDVQAAYDVPAAIRAESADVIHLEDCVFEHLGGYAIEFGKGCSGCMVTGCEMTDLGAGAVKIGEPAIAPESKMKTRLISVTDCAIHDIGIVYPAAVGIWIGQSGGNTIAHNHIHDTFYSGISVGWTWGYGPSDARDNVIEFNRVHDIGRGMLCDMGGIYTLGVQPGTVIRSNVFCDITSYGYGGWGIYLDEGSSSILVENNVVYRTKSGGFHQHYGRENIVRNNIFALAKEGQIIRSRAEEHLSFTFERNVVYWTDGPLLGGNWQGDNYRLDHNLYYNASGGPVEFAGLSLDEWRKKGQDQHSLIDDPAFADPEHGDFRLEPGSAAPKIGFQPIDVSRVGPRKKDDRSR
jgi:parallel beta-helix repeat protein